MRLILTIAFLFTTKSLFAQINACALNDSIHIVVIGSSTAAGAGASTPDSAWVNRYRAYLQTINPANQVTNLARGGYNTYRLQPNYYVAPTGRPSVDSSRNITQAVSLNPDGIIVNLPSNDAAIGIGVNEQMSNFIRLKTVADSFNIPIWVCTTQPRNFSTAQRQVQTLTRDSILKYFGANSINFWSGIANSSNGIDSIFDSGDGVHLNDKGHGLLFQRVVQKQIPNVLASSLPFRDFAILKQELIGFSECGSTSQLMELQYGNLGIQANQVQNITVVTKNLNSQQTDTTRIASNRILNACESEVIQLTLNLSNAGNYEIRSYLNSLDTIPSNDSSSILQVLVVGSPQASNQIDSICRNDSIVLLANNPSRDQVIWYADRNQTQLLRLSDSLKVTNAMDTAFYYQLVRGKLHYSNSLETGTSSTTNWNGFMFNIIAQDSLTIDSLNTKFFDTGAQAVRAFFRNGSYRGYENNANAWSFWGLDSILVNKSGEFHDLKFTPKNLRLGDTLAVYLHLMNSASRLSYRASGSSQTISDSLILINSGSGISHTFGATFSPRNFVGKIYYHYGTNLQGDCASPLVSYQLSTYPQVFDLGADTNLFLNQSLSFNLPQGFSDIFWSNGDTTASITFDQSNLNLGGNLIALSATDFNGCRFHDTLLITLNNAVGLLSNQADANFSIYPNPASENLTVKSSAVLKSYAIINSVGQVIKEQAFGGDFRISLDKIKEGVYWLRILTSDDKVVQKKFVILR